MMEYAVTAGEGRLIDYGLVEFGSDREREIHFNAANNGHLILTQPADEETETGQ